MNILWVATKAPWPPVDGGRRLLFDTLRALAAAGHRLTLVAPIEGDESRAAARAALEPFCRPHLVVTRHRPLVADALRAQLARRPLTLVRHALPAVRRRVGELLEGGDFDLVQAEQVQALDSAAPAAALGLPLVLRAQNVESDLWASSARESRWQRPLLALEARRLGLREGEAVRRCGATLALTGEDAERLGQLSGAGERIHHVPAPFEVELPPAKPLPGEPAVVLFGSGGWRPNAAGAEWFVRRVWPRVLAARPGALLHAFGMRAAGAGVRCHPAPADSRDAYPRGAVLAVPLRVASGVRIKILEAWARGLPVVATPEAARGLDATGGDHLLLARDAEEFATTIHRLAQDADLARRLIDHGRRRLHERHALPRIAERLETIYATLVGPL